MVSDKNLATSIGGKTARACDNCIRKRARWYCGADDAFLCQTCDASVHSANHLAGRHQRVRLKTASEKQVSPSWHHGFTRKARTPRHGKINPRDAKSKSHETQRNQVHHLVPDENSYEENEGQEQLLYRVPVFDPFAAELCLSGTSNEGVRNDGEINDDKYKLGMVNNDNVNSGLHGFYDPSSNMDDLEEFAVDVENLLGKGLDEESSFDMETLGFLDCREKESTETTSSRSTGLTVKKEEEEEEEEEEEMEGSMGNGDMTRETFELNLDDYEEEEEDNKVVIGGTAMNIVEEREEAKQKEDKKILLALDYEGVIAAWADQKSPWTNGDRPELDPNDCWPDFMDCTRGSRFDYGDEMGGSNNNGIAMVLDGGREARVSRYREKRRTRLFSKTIRYEVRKLNAEKRPRIKGRFVKMPKFPAGSGPGSYPTSNSND